MFILLLVKSLIFWSAKLYSSVCTNIFYRRMGMEKAACQVLIKEYLILEFLIEFEICYQLLSNTFFLEVSLTLGT